jgi:hypothetical protein
MIRLDFDVEGIREIQETLGATDRQVWFSIGRALNRTATTLKKLSLQGFKSELGLRNLSFVRRRLRDMKTKATSFQSFRLWYGLNDMPASYFKGNVRKSRKGGASKSSKVGTFAFPNSFIVARPLNGRGRSVYHRKGADRFPIKEDELPIKDRMDVYIEDQIFDKAGEIFMHHFVSDIRRQLKFLEITGRYEEAFDMGQRFSPGKR